MGMMVVVVVRVARRSRCGQLTFVFFGRGHDNRNTFARPPAAVAAVVVGRAGGTRYSCCVIIGALLVLHRRRGRRSSVTSGGPGGRSRMGSTIYIIACSRRPSVMHLVDCHENAAPAADGVDFHVAQILQREVRQADHVHLMQVEYRRKLPQAALREPLRHGLRI